MRCHHCKANVEKAVLALPNCKSASADITIGTLEIEGKLAKEDVILAVSGLGFEIEEL